MVHSAPEKGAIAEVYEMSDASLRDAIKSRLLDDSEELAVEAGYAATLKGVLYSALLAHVREKFLGGSSIGLAEHRELAFAFKKLPEMRRKVAAIPGLVAGIIEYGDQ